MKVASRGNVAPFYVMEVMKAAAEREAQGKRVLHLEVGQPSTPAPYAVRKAAMDALVADKLGYTDSRGTPELRARIARHYRDYYGVRVPADRIVVTTGSSAAFSLSFLSALEHGDRIALAEPGYPAYRNILASLGVEVVGIPVGPETNYQPTPEHLAAVEGPLDALLVASPANPTGTMLDPEQLRALIGWCGDRDIRVIVDEIYHGITYDGRAVTAAAISDNIIVINSFSKYFSMTGWRIGWMVVPPDLARSVECLAQNHFISPPTLSQVGALAAFDCIDEIETNVARYRRNREVLMTGLPRAGLDQLSRADGAFYIYADVGRFTNDATAFCKRMLAETGIAATPGVDFDPHRGHRFVRFSFAGATEDMAEATELLNVWLR
ncbi:MAG: aminotransferase class I/II-fold pyridoxal phosphate-dependent enzyme [Pseudomonadota bacterium]|nr:aminotransferase class I/II-fold pyridoxal phosphate-dependent enzyme [Pseudomonadota bacterium]